MKSLDLSEFNYACKNTNNIKTIQPCPNETAQPNMPADGQGVIMLRLVTGYA